MSEVKRREKEISFIKWPMNKFIHLFRARPQLSISADKWQLQQFMSQVQRDEQKKMNKIVVHLRTFKKIPKISVYLFAIPRNHINSSCETIACAINVSGCDDGSGSLGNKNWFRRIARLSTIYEWCQNKREDEFHEWNCVAMFIVEWKTDAYRKLKGKVALENKIEWFYHNKIMCQR